MHLVVLLFLMYATSILLEARVSMVLSEVSSSLVKHHHFNQLFDTEPLENEDKVLNAFNDKKYHFALVRKDKLKAFMQQAKHRPYYVIGKFSETITLQFFAKHQKYKNIKDLYHTTIAIDSLINHTNGYIKKILKRSNMLYDVNVVSLDIYRAIHALKENKIDTIFMLSSPGIKKKFNTLIKPYPHDFLKILQEIDGLTCNQKECMFEYYLIASEHVGKQVMHNIYRQLESLWAKENRFLSTVGNYYIDVSYVKKIADKKKPIFGRTPWMEVAIKEAILGKGSSEYVMPMLDLSYKYIRFSKGDKGITTAPNDSKMGSWCAAYICWTLNKSGYQVHQKGRMASQSFRYFKDKLYRKIQKPIFGAITLYTSMKNPQHGHVGYLFGHTKQGKNILLGGNQNNRLKFAAYPARGFGSYRFNGFYVPIDYQIKPQDYLTKKDIYPSAKKLNDRYGIRKSKSSHKVR